MSPLHVHEVRLHLKDAAVEVLAGSLPIEARISEFARLLVPSLADFCSVELRGDDHLPETLAVAASDPGKEVVLRRLRQLYSRPPTVGEGVARVFATEQPILLRDIPAEILAGYARDSGEHEHEVRRALERLGARSAMAVPLRIGRRPPLGAIALNMAESGRQYDDADLEFAMELAGVAALAIDNARLFDLERAARVGAERAHDRASFLAEAGFVLDSALGLDERLARLARVAVPRIGDWCAVEVLDQGVRRVLAVEHVEAAKRQLALELQKRYPPRTDEPYGPSAVIRSGLPQLVEEIPDGLLEATAQDAEHLTILRQLGLRSFMCVPLSARGITFGTFTLVTAESGRTFTSDDLSYVQVLAARAGVALDNARLYERQRGIAQTLQQVVLPGALPDIPGLELAAQFRPAGGDEVSGDFYDVFPVGERTVIALVGDVCGKGVEAAAVTALARFSVRATARLEPDPARILELLNTSVREQRTDNRFITLALARISLDTGSARVTVARAGHPYPLILRSSGAVERVAMRGAPVGVLDELRLEEQTIDLRAGDALVFYTDGLTEARNQNKVVFGLDRLEVILSSCAGKSAQGIVETIASSEAAFDQGRRQHDDMVVLVARIPHSRAAASVGPPEP